MKGKLSQYSQSIVRISILAVLTIVFISWSGTNQAQDQHRSSKAVQVNYQAQTADAETGSAPPAQLPTVRKPLSALEQALRDARRAGDEQKVRDIETRLKSQRAVSGENRGDVIHRVSTTVGFPGEPGNSNSVPPGIWGGSPDWGTDIHVRGTNTDFRESYPAMATASDGTIYIVWENVGSTQPHDYLQVYYSTDGGSTWTAYGWFSNPSFDLAQPSLAIGEGSQDLLIIAYVVEDAVPYIEVMTTPLASGTGWSPTYTVPAYYSFWESYAKPNVWTDSYDWNSWYIYLTAEAAFSSASGNYNIVFWRSTDFGSTYDDPAQVPLGNTDPDAWRDPDGSYGGTGNDLFLACFNESDSTLYTLISTTFGSSWSDTISIYKLPDIPNHAVDPDIEASTNTDNIMLCCTKSFAGNDNIGQTYSQDGGQTWTYLFSLDGYTTLDEFAPELNANEGGASWHLAYTSDHHVFYSTRPQDLSTTWSATPEIVDDAQYASHAYTKKGITSNWGSDEAGIAWSDYRDPTIGDYDIYFDRSGGAANLYQGPASGSITGGLFENTNNFTDLQEGGAASSELMQKIIRFRETMLAPDPANMTPSAGPVGSNKIDDQSATDAAPTLLTDFFGIPDDQNSAGYSFIPPDPTCAAGPNHIMAATNTDFAIFDKAGNKLKEIDATEWFENVLPGLDPALIEPFGAAYDPQIVYDHFEDRWVMLYIADDNTSQSYLLLSVSDDWDPNGVWVNYAIPANRNGSTVNSNVNDYPKLGLDVYNLYVTANMFDLGGSGFQYIQIRTIEKFQIYTNMGGPLTYIDFWDLRDPDNISQVLNTASTVAPAVTFGTPGVEYFINASPYTTGTFMTLWTLTDPASPSTLTAVNIPVTAYTSPPDADQLGGGTPLIDVGGRRVRNAVYRNGHLVTAHSIDDGTGSYARIHFVEIDIPSLTPVVDASYGATTYWYYYPAVTLDPSMNGIAVFNRSGTSEYAGIRYTGIVGGAVQGSVQLKAGENNYIKTFGGSRNRWGDYSGIAVDPANPDNVWMFAEYAASPANTWGTWWGEVTYVPPTHPPAENLVALSGYDNSVPVYWDPPSGFPPLESGSSASPFASGSVDIPAKDTQQKAAVQQGSPDGTLSTLLSYDVYRSTTSGGPYTHVANVSRQYYRDLSASNGTTYYYVVKAVYDDGVSGYSNEDAGTPTGGYAFANGYASAPPTLDGSIGAGEWSDATVTDVTFTGSPQPVTMYTMNDGNFLYVAVDDPNNTTAEDYDQVGIYFDEDHNFEWPLASPSGEGNFWVQWFTTGSLTDYRGIYGWWPANLGYDGPISPAPGVSEGISYSSGHSQYEVAIDLSASELNAAPGADIGFYMFSYDGPTATMFGQWPDVVIWNAPFTYGTMVLSSGPVTPPPESPVAFDGYDAAVPLAWDPPSGFPPFDNTGTPGSQIASADKSAKTIQEGTVVTGQSPQSVLQYYNIYRSTTPGGPYTLIATNITRQYYRDMSVANGTTYYYVITAVFDVGESAPSAEVSATPVVDGFVIHSGFALSSPTLDGSIDPVSEWASAEVVDITWPGMVNPVTMYVMNDGNSLYVAVDDPNNSTSEDYDQIGIYFDEDHNFEWPLASPSGEGNFWVQWFTTGSLTDYRGIYGWWPANLGYDITISPAPGVAEGISFSSGHAQYEVAIDLTASELNANPGDDIGFYTYSYESNTLVFTGQWPLPTIWNAPFSYGTLILASGMGPDFAADLIVSDVGGHVANMMFGTAPDATIGYDPAYDQYAPPPPPAGAFDARFKTATDDFIRDFRHTTTTTTTWDVHYRAATGSEPPTLTWDNTQLPADGSSFRLVDPFTGGTLVNVDMRTQNSYVDILNLGHLQIINSVTVTYPMDILSDWNLLGLPLDVTDSYYLDLFPSAIPSTCFGWNGAYFSEDSLDLGYGYWLRFPAATTQNITGFPVADLNIDLISGWNMISGGVNCNVALSNVNDPGGIIIPGTLFGFNGAYYTSDSIKQGVGYWLRTSAAGTINLHCTTAAPSLAKKSTPMLQLDQYPSLTVKDATGANQTLYFNVPVEDAGQKLSYSLPPTPPVGAFDARFSGDYRINETDNGVIRVQSNHYPIVIEAQNLPVDDQHQYVIKEVLPGQKVVKHPLIAGESVEISNSNARALKLERIATVPVKFAVEQNYPNPFNPTTEIRYAIPARDQVEIAIFNTLGQKVKTLISGQQDAGYYSVTWDATNETGQAVGSGIYFYTVRTTKHTVIKKMMLLK